MSLLCALCVSHTLMPAYTSGKKTICSSHSEFGGSNVAGGGLVAMVVVQKVALGEGRALRGAAFFQQQPWPSRGLHKNHKKWMICSHSKKVCIWMGIFEY